MEEQFADVGAVGGAFGQAGRDELACGGGDGGFGVEVDGLVEDVD